MRYKTSLLLVVCFYASSGFADERHSSALASSEPLSEARSLPQAEQDQALRTLALEHARRNDAIAALKTLSYVSDPQELAASLSEIRLLRQSGSDTLAASPSVPAAPGVPGTGGQGGSSLADFTSLMDLIQTTVVPDTWDALGGPSTMSPYPAGILVDGNGVVQDAVVSDDGLLDNIDVLLHADSLGGDGRLASAEDWRLAAPYRCVSLLRLSQEVLRRRITGQAIDLGMRHLAGLSRIQYVILDSAQRDIILVGPVGGIESRQGWMCDLKSGRVVLQLEYLSTAASSIYANQPFGCTIDPTPESMAAAAAVTASVQRGEVPIGMAAERLREAIGLQDVRVFGTAGDTPLGYLMVEADRHMKQLALGLRPLPPGAPDYLDVVTRHLGQGAPSGQLLRLWFTAKPMAVRRDEAGTVFELAGRPLMLSSQTALAARDGGRIPVADDFRLIEFVEEFNKHFDEIASMHPVYGALQSVYTAAAVAELVRRSEAGGWLPGLLGPMLLDDPSLGRLPTPRRVASIATLHRAVHRGTRHWIVVASGGVQVDIRDAVEPTIRTYPSLAGIDHRFTSANQAHWWWNAR